MKMKQRFLSVVCAVGSVAMMGNLRTTANAALAPDSGVRLYTEENYAGTELLFSPEEATNATLNPEYKNKISSLQIPHGFKVTLINQAGRRSRSRTFNAGDHPTVGKQMNNQADTVLVIAE